MLDQPISFSYLFKYNLIGTTPIIARFIYNKLRHISKESFSTHILWCEYFSLREFLSRLYLTLYKNTTKTINLIPMKFIFVYVR